MSEPQRVVVSTKYGKLRLSIQVGIAGVLLFLAGYVTLWADKHNDERYVGQADYAKDRQNDANLRSLTNEGLQRQFAEQSAKLKEISDDVKLLLRESRKNP